MKGMFESNPSGLKNAEVRQALDDTTESVQEKVPSFWVRSMVQY